MTRQEMIRYLVLRSIGNFLVLFAIFGVLATFGPALFFEVRFRVQQFQGVKYVVADPTKTTSPLGELVKKYSGKEASLFSFGAFGDKTQVLIPNDTNFSIVIPKIGANAKVFANTDPISEDNYLPVLKKGVAHAAGTALPDQKGTVYMFAHSTDAWWDVGLYNAIFYLLKDMSVGDDIHLFYKGKRYDYRVTENKISEANDVSYITHARQTPNQLVLQTCWPPGTTWKRIIVTAKPI